MLTVKSVEKKLKKKLSNLKIDKSNLTYKNVISDNIEVDGKSVIFDFGLNFDIDSLLDKTEEIYNQLIEDNLITLPILNNFRYSDNDILRGLKDYTSFLVNNKYYVFYKVYYTENIKTKVKIDKDCIEDAIKNDNLNCDLLKISIDKITPEKINLELGVLYIKK